MRFEENQYGNSLILGGGGLSAIGGGESSANLIGNVPASSESLYLTADLTGTAKAINFYTSMQSG